MGTIADKLDYLNNTKSKLKNEINKIGGNITNETTFRDYVSNINNIYDKLPKIEGSGSDITLNDTEEALLSLTPEGYASQDGTPTPDTPIPIKVVTGEQNVEILNNNYFNINEITENSYITNKGVTGSSSVSNVSNYIEVRGEEQITIEYDYDILLSTSDRSIVFYDENKNYISGQYFKITKKSILITPSQSGFIRFGYDKNCENIRVFNEKQNYPLSLGNLELAKINDYKDFIFKNEIGSSHYNAELDLNGWYVHKNIKKLTYNGSEFWNTYDRTFGGVSQKIFCRESNPGLNSSNRKLLCNYFMNIGTVPKGNYQISYNPSRYYKIDVTYFDISTVEEFKEWLTTHNLIIYGISVEPTYKKITDTTLIQQLENINNNARSYKDTTIIECSSASEENEKLQVSIVALKDLDLLNTNSNTLSTTNTLNNIQPLNTLDNTNELNENEEYEEL